MPAKQFDLIVFDWDGTLMDSTYAIVSAIQAATKEMGLVVPDQRTASFVIGLGLEEALRHIAPDLALADYPQLVTLYRQHYSRLHNDLKLFDGVTGLLSNLAKRGHTLAVATGKGRAGLDRALNLCKLDSVFAATRCADQTFSKPHPAMLLELMEELSSPPKRTLMIGDTTHDLQMANNAGVPAVAVNYGAHGAQELQALDPLAVLNSVQELNDWLMHNA